MQTDVAKNAPPKEEIKGRILTTKANATASRTFWKISNDDYLKLQCFSEDFLCNV